MVHLNDIQEKFDGKGLTILSVTGEPRDKVEAFVDEFSATYPILCQAQSGAYSTGGVPSAYLIDGEGVVAWQGHPGKLTDGDIEDHLKKIDKTKRVSTWAFMIAEGLPPLPKAMKGVVKQLEKKKFGAALKIVDAALPKLEGEDKEAGDKVREFVALRGTEGLESAATLRREGKVYQAYLAYGRVEERYKGHALAKQAKEAVKALKKDKQAALEIKAGEKFEAIKKEMRGEKKAEDKLKCLKPMLSKKYADTVAGKQAATLAEGLGKK